MMTKTRSNTPTTISVRRDRSRLRTEDELFCGDVSGPDRFDDVASDFCVAPDALIESLVAPSLTRQILFHPNEIHCASRAGRGRPRYDEAHLAGAAKIFISPHGSQLRNDRR